MVKHIAVTYVIVDIVVMNDLSFQCINKGQFPIVHTHHTDWKPGDYELIQISHVYEIVKAFVRLTD